MFKRLLTGTQGSESREAQSAAWTEAATVKVCRCSAARAPDFQALGLNQRRPFFEHRWLVLPKAAPDALRVGRPMCGVRDPSELWQLVLYAQGPVAEEFPPDLFFDCDIAWHQQHFGLPHHVGYASFAVMGDRVFGLNYVADVVQRIGRRREWKTRIENRFKGWPSLVLNGLMVFASERGLREVRSPTAAWVMRHTDPERDVGPELFERIYDRSVESVYRTRRTDRWWIIEVERNRDRIVLPEVATERRDRRKTICIAHDTERGLGHTDTDPAFAAEVDAPAARALDEMLRIEEGHGVRATYNVVGVLMPDVRRAVEAHGHEVAFHSYDHRLGSKQLQRCREVDYRVPGYRPPRSKMTRELRPRSLCLYNFDWIAAAASVLHTSVPRLANRIVDIPVHLDDYELFRHQTPYDDWEGRLLDTIAQRDFVAFGLHDCYAAWWLSHYDRLLEKLEGMGVFLTFSDIAREIVLAAAV